MTQRRRPQAERGVRVTEVGADSPAAKAGLKANDVIIEFNSTINASKAHYSSAAWCARR